MHSLFVKGAPPSFEKEMDALLKSMQCHSVMSHES